ncbi:unnamed protein product [Parascedosporium putredinis]|uniref:Uncharacterized protein n=1 Tax=Parascedosporium putredinis TaxID=1442378 RepID=A0A9P1M8X8_9PEZI|nr:unnamed protein product [Parascedosporium putredinis]CAI7989753.1 unnamed protein product [Parascedosporium putredinis]
MPGLDKKEALKIFITAAMVVAVVIVILAIETRRLVKALLFLGQHFVVATDELLPSRPSGSCATGVPLPEAKESESLGILLLEEPIAIAIRVDHNVAVGVSVAHLLEGPRTPGESLLNLLPHGRSLGVEGGLGGGGSRLVGGRALLGYRLT